MDELSKMNMIPEKRRPGRPRKHDEKLVPVTGYVSQPERALVEACIGKGSIGDWVRDAIQLKIALRKLGFNSIDELLLGN